MQSRHSPGQGALISPALLVTLVGAAIAAIGVFLPWLQLEYEGQSFEFGAFEKDLGWIITGTDGVDDESGSFAHGSIILVLAGLIAVAAVMVALGQVAQRRLVPGLASGVLFVLVAGDLGSFLEEIDDAEKLVPGLESWVGAGGWLSLAGSGMALIAALVGIRSPVGPSTPVAAQVAAPQPPQWSAPPAPQGWPVPQPPTSPPPGARSPAPAPPPTAPRPEPRAGGGSQWWNDE